MESVRYHDISATRCPRPFFILNCLILTLGFICPTLSLSWFSLVALINLMEVLSGKKARRHFKTPNNRIQYFNK